MWYTTFWPPISANSKMVNYISVALLVTVSMGLTGCENAKCSVFSYSGNHSWSYSCLVGLEDRYETAMWYTLLEYGLIWMLSCVRDTGKDGCDPVTVQGCYWHSWPQEGYPWTKVMYCTVWYCTIHLNTVMCYNVLVLYLYCTQTCNMSLAREPDSSKILVKNAYIFLFYCWN